MADPNRHRYSNAPGRRSPVYNPARASMPVTSVGYSSLYGGDIHVLPTSRHESLSRPPAGDYRPTAVPVATTTYAVRKEPLSRSTSVKENGNRAHRSSTIDLSAKRPIIVTTKHAPSASQPSAGVRSGSPSRDPYRSSDEGTYYSQPASSINRSRSTTRAPFSAAMEDDEYQRLKERTEHDRLVRPRQGALYANVPHRSSTLDYGSEGYEYTKPSDLARYDLDNDQRRRTRRDSIDRYYRPSVSITSDIGRPYEQNERRPRGPPPTTWGLDKINRAPVVAPVYDAPGMRMPIPPAAPLAPDPARRSSHLDLPGSPTRDTVRPRPVSLIHDAPGRSSHHDDYYRGREDDLMQREMRENRDYEYFQDDSVTARGFGIRVDPKEIEDHYRAAADARHRDERRERRDGRKEFDDHEPRRRSDDDFEHRERKYNRDHRVDDDHVRDRRDAKTKERASSEDEHSSRREKMRDKVAAGIGIAAASLGLGSAAKERDDKDKEDISSPRRRRDDEDFDDYEMVERPRKEAPAETEPESRHRNTRETEARLNGNPATDAAAVPPRDHSSSADEGKTAARRRPRASSAFDPTDTAGLLALKAQLAAEEEKKKVAANEVPSIREPSPERKAPPADRLEGDGDSAAMDASDDSRGRELAPPAREEKQVRVVSPPRDREEKKPIKGILKQPKPQFPEEPNPIREGVAPHKDDKTKANVPPGARWTKISRKMVNPEALTIGKERFEVRDEFVIVLRVLSKEEIQAYAAATAQLR
ncbi:hypothetical protein QBC46DRAFT_290555, partial [Diplogelasinospora grovesii]